MTSPWPKGGFLSLLQEVITNEHVVAMMKAAISETEDMPLFVSSFLSVCPSAEGMEECVNNLTHLRLEK